MTNTNSPLLDQLKNASNGLLFMSESDAPIEPFHWEAFNKQALNPESLLQRTGHSECTPVEVVDVDSFFKVVTTEQDWQEKEEKETVKKFQTLVETLKHNLSDIKVYRLGKTDIDVYIVGKTASGEYAGISTKVVET
jgi:hypothetical protein